MDLTALPGRSQATDDGLAALSEVMPAVDEHADEDTPLDQRPAAPCDLDVTADGVDPCAGTAEAA